MFFNKQRRIDQLERAQVLDAVMGLQQVLNEADVINELLLVAQRVATRMERGEDARRWANRLVAYIDFSVFNRTFTLPDGAAPYVAQLREIGKLAGVNGAYRTDYGSAAQF